MTNDPKKKSKKMKTATASPQQSEQAQFSPNSTPSIEQANQTGHTEQTGKAKQTNSAKLPKQAQPVEQAGPVQPDEQTKRSGNTKKAVKSKLVEYTEQATATTEPGSGDSPESAGRKRKKSRKRHKASHFSYIDIAAIAIIAAAIIGHLVYSYYLKNDTGVPEPKSTTTQTTQTTHTGPTATRRTSEHVDEPGAALDRMFESSAFSVNKSNNSKINEAELTLAKYVAADPKERKKMAGDLHEALKVIENQMGTCSGHLVYLAQWMRNELSLPTIIKTFTPWQRGCYEHLVGMKNLSAALQARVNMRRETADYDQALQKIAGRTFGESRGNNLVEIFTSQVSEKQLKNKTVIDIGGGLGMLSAKLTPLVGTKGKVICVDGQPQFATFCQNMAKYAPEFAGIEYRIVDIENGSLNLEPQKADYVAIFDTGLFGILPVGRYRYSPEVRKERIAKSTFDALKPGGQLLLFNYSADSPAELDVAKELTKAGFTCVVKHNADINNTVTRPAYLILATKPKQP